MLYDYITALQCINNRKKNNFYLSYTSSHKKIINRMRGGGEGGEGWSVDFGCVTMIST